MKLDALIVDDEPVTQFYIQSVLESLGFEVLATTTSSEGLLKLLDDYKGGLIVADINLDNESTVFEALDKTPHINNYSLIFITGRASERDYERCLGFKPLSYLSKPFSRQSLLFAVNQYLQTLDGVNSQFNELTELLQSEDLRSNDIKEKISHIIRAFREGKKITQAEFSDYTGISLRQLQRIEACESNINVEILTVLLNGIREYKG